MVPRVPDVRKRAQKVSSSNQNAGSLTAIQDQFQIHVLTVLREKLI